MTGYVSKKMLGAARLPDTPSARAYLDRVLDDDDTHKSGQRDYWLEHFAALVEAKARADEREACAKVADGWPDYDVQGLADAIRARGNT
jgi:hypothetical protein